MEKLREGREERLQYRSKNWSGNGIIYDKKYKNKPWTWFLNYVYYIFWPNQGKQVEGGAGGNHQPAETVEIGLIHPILPDGTSPLFVVPSWDKFLPWMRLQKVCVSECGMGRGWGMWFHCILCLCEWTSTWSGILFAFSLIFCLDYIWSSQIVV